jgi:hypothetical protein
MIGRNRTHHAAAGCIALLVGAICAPALTCARLPPGANGASSKGRGLRLASAGAFLLAVIDGLP